MTETIEGTKKSTAVLGVAPFTIEIDHPRNDDVLVQCIPGLRLRSAIDGSKGIQNEYGDNIVPTDQARSLAGFPRTPGMHLAVHPQECSYMVSDPMRDDEELCRRVKTFLNQNSPYRPDAINGVPSHQGKLDVDAMKSLCREIRHILNAGWAKVVTGPEPLMEDIDDLPGRYLMNPGSRVQNTQPRYEDEYSDWVQNLSRLGG